MRRAEAEDLVEAWLRELGLHAVQESFRPKRFAGVHKRTLSLAGGEQADRVWLLAEEPDPAALEVGRFNTIPTGTALFSLPKEAGEVLYKATLAARSDWFDDDWEQVREQLFKRAAPRLRKLLKRPVWVVDLHTGEAAPEQRLGYTAGAEDWVSRSGKLAQVGVANVGFALTDPAAPLATRPPG